MDLRDEAFHEFVRQFSGKGVAELLAFQEINGVDSLLGCQDLTAVLHLESDQLNDIKENMCITLSDGSIALFPDIESSINYLVKRAGGDKLWESAHTPISWKIDTLFIERLDSYAENRHEFIDAKFELVYRSHFIYAN